MRFLAIVGLMLVSITGCKKEDFDPVNNQFSLIGLWVSDDARTTLDIKNVNGTKGEDEVTSYTEVRENGTRYLRRVRSGMPTTWQILRITPDELILYDINTGGEQRFWKAS